VSQEVPSKKVLQTLDSRITPNNCDQISHCSNYLQRKANLHLLRRIGCLGRIEEDKFAFYLIIQKSLNIYHSERTYYVHIKLFLPFVLLLLHHAKPWLRHQQCTSFVYNFQKKFVTIFSTK